MGDVTNYQILFIVELVLGKKMYFVNDDIHNLIANVFLHILCRQKVRCLLTFGFVETISDSISVRGEAIFSAGILHGTCLDRFSGDTPGERSG